MELHLVQLAQGRLRKRLKQSSALQGIYLCEHRDRASFAPHCCHVPWRYVSVTRHVATVNASTDVPQPQSAVICSKNLRAVMCLCAPKAPHCMSTGLVIVALHDCSMPRQWVPMR